MKNTILQSKRKRLLIGIFREIGINKVELMNVVLTLFIGIVIGVYFGFVFFYFTVE